MLFSVVVPVYNVENYLKECIESVLEQNFNDYEIIIVDDGSTDGSPELCDEIKEKSENIKVIHKSNGGLSDARNVGTAQAVGRYIIYLDSDDYWDDVSFLRKLSIIIEGNEPDIIVFGYKKIMEGNEISFYKPHSVGGTIEQLVLDSDFNICAWDKAIKREIITLNNISFRRNVYSEDMEWCSLIYMHSSKVEVLRETPHCYRQRNGSITKKITEKNIVDVRNNFEKCLQIKKNMPQGKSTAFDYFLSKNISMFMIALSQLEKDVQAKYYPFVRQNLSFLKKNTRIRETLIYMSTKIIGISATEKLLSYAFGVKKIR